MHSCTHALMHSCTHALNSAVHHRITLALLILFFDGFLLRVSAGDEKSDTGQLLFPYVFEEVLPIHHPGTGLKTLVLPFTNKYNVPVMIDSHSITCLCSKNVSYPKRWIMPQESILIELDYEVLPKIERQFHLQFKLKGHRENLDQPHEVELAVYQITVPIFQPFDQPTQFGQIAVLKGKVSRVVVVNSSGIPLTRASGRIVGWPEFVVSCSFSEFLVGKTRYQTIIAEIDGLEKYFATKHVERPQEIDLRLFGAVDHQVSEVSVYSSKIPVRWLSDIEFFPKTVDVPSDMKFVEINLVGRSMQLANYESQLEVNVNGEKRERTEYSIIPVSSKWLRLQIPREVAMPNEKPAVVVVVLPEFQWRFEIPVSKSQ
jgi:hypothetical protein